MPARAGDADAEIAGAQAMDADLAKIRMTDCSTRVVYGRPTPWYDQRIGQSPRDVRPIRHCTERSSNGR
jgi:hypothetical protein